MEPLQRRRPANRRVRRRLEEFVGTPPETEPFPCPQCRICDFKPLCDAYWDKVDHLSRVAGISRGQIEKLERRGVATLAACGLFATKSVTVKLLPFDNKSEIAVVVDLAEGASLEDTERTLFAISVASRALPEIVSTQAYAGTAAPFNFNGLVRHSYLRAAPELRYVFTTHIQTGSASGAGRGVGVGVSVAAEEDDAPLGGRPVTYPTTRAATASSARLSEPAMTSRRRWRTSSDGSLRSLDDTVRVYARGCRGPIPSGLGDTSIDTRIHHGSVTNPICESALLTFVRALS